MADKTGNYGSNAKTSEGVESSKSETMHIYGSGDNVGNKNYPKGAEILRKRAEPGTQEQK